MPYLNGFSGDVDLGGTSLDVTKWSANWTTEVLPTTNTGSGGAHEGIYGTEKVEGTFEAFFDDTTSPTTAIFPGVTAATLTLTIGSTAKSFSFDALISQVTVENAAEGAITFSANFVSTGAITKPADA